MQCFGKGKGEVGEYLKKAHKIIEEMKSEHAALYNLTKWLEFKMAEYEASSKPHLSYGNTA